MNHGILLTGATGFLGTEITTELIKRTDKTLYVFVHAKTVEDAVCHMKAAWIFHKELCDYIGGRIIPVPGDITYYDLRLTSELRNRLIKNTDYVIHCAEENNLCRERGDIFSVNLDGTQFLLNLAKEIHRHHGLTRFVHVSTAFVSGKRTGVVFEKEDLPEEFANYLEESKAEAEKSVCQSGLPYVICRPGLLVGDSRTGRSRSFNLFYECILLLLTWPIPLVPVSPKQKLNFIPVDYVASSIVTLTFEPVADTRVYHLTMPDILTPYVYEIRDYIKKWAKKELGISVFAPLFPLNFLQKISFRFNEKTEEKENNRKNRLISMASFFYTDVKYDRTNTDKCLGIYEQKWQDYFEGLLSYACQKNFIDQTENTVFEHSMVRREDIRNPINYHNMTEYGVEHFTGQQLNELINTIAGAMEKNGIKKGDKVAISGYNSTEYVAVEMAIGLLGGISIPINIDTSVKQIQKILAHSKAKWFFIGSKEILKKVWKFPKYARMISFLKTEDLDMEDEDIKRSFSVSMLTKWEEFLIKQNSTYTKTLLSPDDLATIRYVFNDDDQAKGITFSYGQLRSMGEIMTDILPWKKRKQPVRYLSFLPYSDGVEAIIAAYFPYYLQCNVDCYYLNDRTKLNEALPEVCPTIFYAPSYFYEEKWKQLMESPIGKEYQITRGSLPKAILAKILKSIFLWKNGLIFCKQIIVGGEQAKSELLYQYREIGIEIHQAFGIPEAPMISLNRLGDNMIPSIGTALSDTQIVADDNRELTVTGSQVSSGYYDEEDERLINGSFRMGIRGGSGKNHHIFITGYKDEEFWEDEEVIEEIIPEEEPEELDSAASAEKKPWRLEPLNVDIIKKGLRTIEHRKSQVQPQESIILSMETKTLSEEISEIKNKREDIHP